MASDASIKKSLEFHKGALAGVLEMLTKHWRAEHLKSNFINILECDPTSLEAAARFFGLDHTREAHREILLLLLAQAVFGKKVRGPKRGTTITWSDERYIILGYLAGQLSHQNPRWSNEKIAAAICDKGEQFKAHRKDPTTIRKKIPAARRAFQRFLLIENLSGGRASRT